jgi:L-amino acid N-acyltransferase YncA
MRHRLAMPSDLVIEPATSGDAAQIAAIYAHHVLHGTASWEIEPPSVEEIAGRMARILGNGWPWLVARAIDGAMLGYAYAGQYNAREGYRYACENSIYIRHDMIGCGIGKQLLAALLEACSACGFRQMVAGIAGTEPASVALHAKAGFVEVGRLKSLGRKHGQWLDVLYMQRALGPGDATPPREET